MARIAWSCVVAALFAVVGDVLALSAIGVYYKDSSHQNYEDFVKLDPFLIEEDFALRSDLKGLELAARIFGAVAWVVLCIPLLQVTIELSASGQHLKGLHVAIAVLTVIGASTEFIANVMYAGAATTMEWISTDFNLDFWAEASDPPEDGRGTQDKIGWRALQVVSLCIDGFLLWIDAVEWLFLACILFLLFLSIQRQPDNQEILSISFGGFGLFLSLLCIIDFCAEVLRFKSWMTFSTVAFAISFISRIFLWPIWYFWLGFLLSKASARSQPQHDTITTSALTVEAASTGASGTSADGAVTASTTMTTEAKSTGSAPNNIKESVFT